MPDNMIQNASARNAKKKTMPMRLTIHILVATWLRKKTNVSSKEATDQAYKQTTEKRTTPKTNH